MNEIKNKIKSNLRNDKSLKNRIIISILSFIIISIFIIILEKKYFLQPYAYDRLIIFSLLNFFISLCICFKIENIMHIGYKYRYIISVFILIFLVIMKYHGSSLSIWNYVVQPSYSEKTSSVVLGLERNFRGDEFFISTPTILSQYFNNFQSTSNLLMGLKGSVLLFPTLPCKSITILANICYLPYLFLPLENAFSCSWFLKLFLIFFSSFELFCIVTNNKKKFALTGAILITFSGASCWWSNMSILWIGPTAVIILQKFISTDKKIYKILLSVLMGIIGANYLMLMYPAWQVPFGYAYLGFFIWLIIKNREKVKVKDLLYVPIVLCIIFLLVFPAIYQSMSIYKITASTVYPGARVSVGGLSVDRLFSYYMNIFFYKKNFSNPCEYSNFMSFYPLPIIISIIYIINQVITKKKSKKGEIDSFLVIFTIIALLISTWNYVKIPLIVSKITMLSFSTDSRAQLVVGYICIFLLIRILANYENNNKISVIKLVVSLIISILFNLLIFVILYHFFSYYLTLKMFIILAIIFIPVILFIIINNQKTNNYLLLLLIIISFFTGVCINPLSKGLSVFYKKPISTEIQKIVNKDPDARWLAIGDNYALSNYTIANGAITINSTNYYPNLKLWKKLDPSNKYEKVYNRYSHVKIKLTNKKTSFELLTTDSYIINLNVNDIEKLDVDYIMTTEPTKKIEKILPNDLKKIYSEDNISIYKLDS